MKIKNISVFTLFLSVLFGTLFTACDTEFNEIGSDVLGDEQFHFEKYAVQKLSVENQFAGTPNTKNLPVNSLGYFDDNLFGTQTAHLVTQIELASNSSFTNITTNPIIDSVYVYIPFNLASSTTNADGTSTYNVANVYGDGTFDLKVYRNGYFLSETNPGNTVTQQYYFADQKTTFDANIASPILNTSTNSAQNSAFKFNKNEIILYKYNADGSPQLDNSNQPIVKERKAPGIWLDLNKTYFQQTFFANNTYQSLLNNALLKDYFRGLYFQINNPNGNALAQLNLAKAQMVIIFKQDKTDGTRERRTLTFNLGNSTTGNQSTTATTVNLIENTNTNTFENAINNRNSDHIWLKGNLATVAKINLFGDDVNQNGKPDELEEIIAKNLYINQAVLTVSVDENITGTSTDRMPNRLFLYDYKNQKVLVDYAIDQSTNPTKSVYGGILNANTKKYQFSITEYVNALVKKDSTNFQLGLVVANDITQPSFNVLKNQPLLKIPVTATMFPFGTVLYGPNHSNADKKMKLEIYYSKPD